MFTPKIGEMIPKVYVFFINGLGNHQTQLVMDSLFCSVLRLFHLEQDFSHRSDWGVSLAIRRGLRIENWRACLWMSSQMDPARAQLFSQSLQGDGCWPQKSNKGVMTSINGQKSMANWVINYNPYILYKWIVLLLDFLFLGGILNQPVVSWY